MEIHVRLNLSLASLIAFIILISSATLLAILLSIVEYEGKSIALDSAAIIFNESSKKTIAKIDSSIKNLSTITNTASFSFSSNVMANIASYAQRDLYVLMSLLEENKNIMSVYVGYMNGTFHQLIAVRNDADIIETYRCPHETNYIDRWVYFLKDGEGRQRWDFYNGDMKLLSARFEESASYDPRQRPWYTQAMKSEQSVYTDPYVFSSSRLPGITCAKRLDDGKGVFGVDMTLAQLGDMLAKQRMGGHGISWIANRQGRVVAIPGLNWKKALGPDMQLPLASQSSDPLVRSVARAFQGAAMPEDVPFFIDIEGSLHMAVATSMDIGQSLVLHVITAAPVSDFTKHIHRLLARIVVVAGCLLVLLVPLAVLLSRRSSRSVKALVRETEKIQRFDFSPSESIKSNITEVQKLIAAFAVMKTTIQTKTESLVRTQEKLELLVRSGVALSAEKDWKALVSLIFQTAMNLVNADGGVLYLRDGEALEVEMVSVGSRNLVLGGLSGSAVPQIKFKPEDAPSLSSDSVLRPAGEAFLSRKILSLADCSLTLFPLGQPEEPEAYAVNSLIAAPIVNHRGEIFGVIQLLNAMSEGAEASEGGGRSAADFVGSLAAQAAVTLDNRALLHSLQDLFDSLVQMVAASIDAKSPYTAGHCRRVPILTELLAQAAHEATQGSLSDFRMESPWQWRQLWIASWLHDCGKVTTPEHIVDKGAKLETIYNRIHEIRTRFEVLRRDAEIAYLQGIIQGEEDASVLRQRFDACLAQLEDDFDFIAQCNVGAEFMTNEDERRIRKIAERVWMRHYSDRVGLSEDELRRKNACEEPDLPTPEPLLSDKADQILERTKDYSYLKYANGDPLEAPAHEWNKGELYNLRIRRGTLTLEERFKIREHTLSGLEMLSKIPFPPHLSRVTDIAMAHHETLDGSGYPLKKHGAQLSVEARILAIADIFEALTASDRPYKKAKTVFETLEIMRRMRDEGRIDADLFDIFLTSGAFRQYARDYLAPEQNDVEDVSPYLTSR
jgi:HD-GYP domain-containing protein (c-di-GMP phosphodiesterase class II)